MNENIRILIADDHPIVRQGLTDLFIPRNGMEVVGEAQNGLEAVEMAQELQPDVIVLDLVMPQLNGADAARQIITENPDAKILILTSFGETEHLEGTLRAGVLGYVLKDSPPDYLLQAIRSVNQGQLTLTPHLALKLIDKPSKEQGTKRGNKACTD
jgi:DNA-binding NarL/FixJ family response regulator